MSLNKKSIYITALTLIFISITCFSQSEFYEEKFDKVFEQWNKPNTPGVVACAIHNGSIIYLKGFGTADLKDDTKITPQTKFQVDDFAKQFTVLAILLLESQGKLSFEDDIRKYLTNFPEYNYTIKIKHLLNHSSGLNDFYPVKQLIGIKSNNVLTQSDALKIIRTQKKLSFKPGTDFSYFESDTEVLLMTEIITNVVQKSFIEFTLEEIFIPLGMSNTTFNNERKLLDNAAKSYRIGKQMVANPINDLTLGITNLYTTAEDLAIWYLNYYNTITEHGKLIKKLDTPVTLDNGKTYKSSWGEMVYGRYFEHLERGLPKKWQYGLVGGYASNMFRFDTKGYIFFVMGNNNRYNGMPAGSMIDVVLEDEYPEPPTFNYNKLRTVKLTTKQLKKYEGFFWNKKNGTSVQIYVKNDSLRYKRLRNNRENVLLPLNDSEFQFYSKNSNDKIILNFIEDDKISTTIGESDETFYQKYTPNTPKLIELNDYEGNYYNNDLSVIYTFSIKEGNLVAKSFTKEKVLFQPIIKDVFRSNTLMFSTIKFIRDKSNKIKEFSINADGVTGLSFKKIKDN